VAKRALSARGILTRLASGLALVLFTFNPSGHSYYHWALRDLSQFSAIQAVPGVLLLCGWVLFVRAALASLGWLGLALASLAIAALVWLLVDAGLLDASGARPLAWIALVSLGLVLGVGLSWSLVRGRITGQVDVDRVDR
jgi:hypothetical protein